MQPRSLVQTVLSALSYYCVRLLPGSFLQFPAIFREFCNSIPIEYHIMLMSRFAPVIPSFLREQDEMLLSILNSYQSAFVLLTKL